MDAGDNDSEGDLPSIEEILAEMAEEIAEEVNDESEVGKILHSRLDEPAEEAFENMKEVLWEDLEDYRSEMDGFENRLYDTWKEPLDLLEAFILVATEIGNQHNEEFRSIGLEEQDYVQLVLQKLHGRACQISREIFVLLRSGYADGAHARWRSLHEVAAVAMFIRLSGQEAAKRFLLHSRIDEYWQAQTYRENQDKLGFDPISDDVIDALEDEKDHLLDHFGNEFGRLWGWAAHEVSGGNFREIEEAAGLSHHRPYYVFASKLNIHAGAKSTDDRLGLIDSRKPSRTSFTTLAGPSNIGLTLPGTHAAASLHQVLSAMIAHRSSAEYIWLMKIAEQFIEEIQDAFPKVRAELNQREDEYWDWFLNEYLEEHQDEFLENYEPIEPPFIEITLEDDLEDEE